MFQNGGVSIGNAEIPTGEDFVDEVKLEISAAFDEVDAVGRRDADGDDDQIDQEVKADGENVEDGHVVITAGDDVDRLVGVVTVIERRA